ncbi:uncharacterized protein UDID_18207 [Ustilago sp. UG-2017a]|nr:uncharacterized protein UDID_18207 [Ustilago sp. UG-2017a]
MRNEAELSICPENTPPLSQLTTIAKAFSYLLQPKQGPTLASLSSLFAICTLLASIFVPTPPRHLIEHYLLVTFEQLQRPALPSTSAYTPFSHQTLSPIRHFRPKCCITRSTPTRNLLSRLNL